MQIKTFQDLIVWQKAHALTLKIYKLTKEFPKDEQFGVTSQLRRAMSSVPANIVEGFTRHSGIEKKRFYNIAQGSLEEAHYFCILANDLGYLKFDFKEDFEKMGQLIVAFTKGAKNT